MNGKTNQVITIGCPPGGGALIGPAPGLDLMFVLSHVPADTGICNGCVHAQEKHFDGNARLLAKITALIPVCIDNIFL